MNERVRVRNTTKYDIGLVTMNGLGYNIKPGLFVMMNRDDVEYNMALAPSLFREPAQLVVEDEELSQAAGIEDFKKAAYTEADLEKVLKGSANKLKTFLEENQENRHVLEGIAQLAMKADLPASKIRVLQEAMPNRDFME